MAKNYSERACEACGQTFKPAAPNQLSCSPEHAAERNRGLRRRRERVFHLARLRLEIHNFLAELYDEHPSLDTMLEARVARGGLEAEAETIQDDALSSVLELMLQAELIDREARALTNRNREDD
jgi:hypothetical protein